MSESNSFSSFESVSGIASKLQSPKGENGENSENMNVSLDDFDSFGSKSSSKNSEIENNNKDGTQSSHISAGSVKSASSKKSNGKNSAIITDLLISENKKSNKNISNNTGLSGDFLDTTTNQSTIKSDTPNNESKSDHKNEKSNVTESANLSVSSRQKTDQSSKISTIKSNKETMSSTSQTNNPNSKIKSQNTTNISSSKLSSKTQKKDEKPKVEPVRQQRKAWYEENQDLPKKDDNKDAEIERLQILVREQRTVINNQKETIRLLMSEAVSHEEITSLRAALASKSPLLQLVAATPMSEQRTTKQLRTENAALRREIDEVETRHLNELKAMRSQFALLSSRQTPTDGCAQCKRKIRELENQLKQYQSQV